MQLRSTLFIAILAVWTGTSHADCPENFVSWGGNNYCYWFSDDNTYGDAGDQTWEGAQEECNQLYGSHLAKIESTSEEDFISDGIRDADGGGADVNAWIGLRSVSGSYRWTLDNTSPISSLWAPTQPTGTGDCVAYHYDTTAGDEGMDNLDCTVARPYVCRLQDACSLISCQNGGVCDTTSGINGRYKAYCDCATGYRGEYCEEEVPACYSNPCVNGATCVGHRRTTYTCLCPNGYSGPNCATTGNSCSTQSLCGASETCLQVYGYGNLHVCSCQPYAVGSVCQNNNYQCPQGCVYGTCQQQSGFYRCVCNQGYYGDRCDRPYSDPCSPNPCKYGAVCKPDGYGGDGQGYGYDNYYRGYRCECNGKTYGQHCENCKPGYGGPYCEDNDPDWRCGGNCDDDDDLRDAEIGLIIAVVILLLLIIIVLCWVCYLSMRLHRCCHGGHGGAHGHKRYVGTGGAYGLYGTSYGYRSPYPAIGY